MTLNVYRDTAASTGHASIFELVTRLLANGWTTVSYSDGTTRTATTADCPSAATLNASSAYVVLTHTSTGMKLGLQRKADSNTWTIQITEGGQALSGGNATTMESNATYTKTLLSNAQLYPSTGTTTTKLHTVVDNASASFVIMGRRSPFVGGSCCFYIYLDYFTPLTWSANPQPWIAGVKFDNSDVASAALVSAGGVNYAWYKRGISGESWVTSWALENPASVAGSGTADPSGSDVEFEARWVGSNTVLGKSTLFKLVQPYRTPTGGMDSGTSYARAAFGQVTVANDGTALAS
jgi:hypothetical protein